MAEYIDRDALIDSICAGCGWDGICTAKCIDLRTIRDFPAADVAPVVRGKWIEVRKSPASITYACSNCEVESALGVEHYCWNCGAKMEETE